MPDGKVYLVGAGPGDPGLITVRGLECVRRAEVLVYDYLVPPRLIDEAPRDAERIYVGKRGGKRSTDQANIEKTMIDRANAGKLVVRLKGGDPFVFGRGGEEALTLKEHGIQFEVVPGVTAGIAAPAYAGIPVTHRGLSATVAFVTGHEDPTKDESDVDWDALAGLGTLVFYMGMRNLETIASNLIQRGKPADTPAAVIQWGATPRQRSVTATLATIAEQAQALEPPAIVVIGDVVKLHEQLAWFDDRPLFGKRIVVTRSRTQASRLRDRLEARGAEVTELPTIEIVPPSSYEELDREIGRLNEFDWVLFTSVNGVDHFSERLAAAGKDSRALADVLLGAIGTATAERIARHGLRADLVPERHVAEGLLDALKASAAIEGKRFLLPRARVARDVLPEGLRAAGGDVTVVAAYGTVIPRETDSEALTAVRRADIDMITFASSSTVRNFAELVGPEGVRSLRGRVEVASIGPVTSETIREVGLDVSVEAQTITIDGLVEAIVSHGTPGPAC